MANDPNWLYNTIAQSSAAIVAIVAGFITASILMLLAEKRSLNNHKNEKEIRLNEKEAAKPPVMQPIVEEKTPPVNSVKLAVGPKEPIPVPVINI